MQTLPELTFVVEEKRGAIDVFTTWLPRIGLACTMVGAVIVDVFVQHSVGFALFPLVLLGIVVAVWFSGRFGAGSVA